MDNLTLLTVSEAEFIRLVGIALRNFDSLLELSRSPLATEALIAPALVLDELNPTSDDRGRALRVLLRWSVSRLAPAPSSYPLGSERPFDDPTWREALWWRYNLLRHSYIEPIHPDLLEGAVLRDKLSELTGIPSLEALLNERSRGVREVALLLREQLRLRDGDAELRRMAVEDYLQEAPQAARALLELASVFRWVFPRRLLMEMAAAERLAGVPKVLDYLVSQRLLLTGDSGASLLTPPALQGYLHARQPLGALERRHAQAARYYSGQQQSIRAAWHLQQGGRPMDAADALLASLDLLAAEGQASELSEVLAAFGERQLPGSRWYQVQLALGDLCQRLGKRAEAMAAYRAALKVADNLPHQARIYRRLGKLYEDDNQLRSLGYYQNAAQGLDPDDPELIDLLKDRAWLQIIRREWEQAEADLMLALEKTGPAARRQRADIYHALAGLYRRQALYDTAIPYAQQALNMREEMGDLQRVAESCSTLGLIYDEMGDHDQALQSYQEALDTFRRIGDREGIGTSLLNIGAACYCTGRFTQAGEVYLESLQTFKELGLPRAIAQAYQNLAENDAALGQATEARWHWQEGYRLATEAGLDDQEEEFRLLRERTPLLQEAGASHLPASLLPPVEQAALELARRHGSVTPRMLIERGFSKPTATRHLSLLATRGMLLRRGRGRSVAYILPESPH